MQPLSFHRGGSAVIISKRFRPGFSIHITSEGRSKPEMTSQTPTAAEYRSALMAPAYSWHHLCGVETGSVM